MGDLVAPLMAPGSPNGAHPTRDESQTREP
jgi:hypothetical protein